MRTAWNFVLVASLALGTACGGGGGGGGGPPADVLTPIFWGVQCVSTAGGPAVRLDWMAGQDNVTLPGSLRYRVFVAGTAGGQNFGAPILTTGPGATSAIVTNAHSPLIALNQRAYFVVRALDQAGNLDDNTVEVSAIPVPDAQVAFVDDTAAGPGVLGDHLQPYPTIQAAITDVETAGGGAVVVTAANGGTDYGEELTFANGAATSIGLFGGFPRLDAQPPAADGDDFLALRNKAAFPATLLATALGLSDTDFLRVVNARTPTFIDGFTFNDDGANFGGNAAVNGVDADLQVSGSNFRMNGFVRVESPLTTELNTLVVVGNDIREGGNTAIQAGGRMDRLVVANNHIRNRSDGVGQTSTMRVLPLTFIAIIHNLFINVNDGVDLTFDPEIPTNPNVLDFRIQHNELRDIGSTAFRLGEIGDVGQNGRATLAVDNNLITGYSSEVLLFDTIASDPHPGVDVDVFVRNNVATGGNSNFLDVDLGVSASRTTRFIVDNNFSADNESEVIEIDDEESGTLDVHNQGRLLIDIRRLNAFAGNEDLDIEIGVTPNGVTDIKITEATFLQVEEPALNLRVDNFIGSATVPPTFPGGVYCLNVFNNMFHGGDDEGLELRDQRGSDPIAALAFFGSNHLGPTSDPSETGVDFDSFTNSANGLFLFHRNWIGGGGQDDDEGFEWDSSNQWLGNRLLIVNNTTAANSGDGFDLAGGGSRPFLINNTVVYNGQGFSENGIAFESNGSTAIIENTLLAFNAETDLDTQNGGTARYSMIRDLETPIGFGNVIGGLDPLFAKGLLDLTGFPFDPTTELSDLFTLHPASPARNAGDPDPFLNDPDGSRNDIGAFGGPGSGSIGILSGGTALPFQFLGALPRSEVASGIRLVPDNSAITLAFNKDVDFGTIGSISVTSNGVGVAGAFAPTLDGKGVRFTPNTSLVNGGSSFVDLTIGTGLRATDGTFLAFRARDRLAVRPGVATAESEPNDVSDGVIDAADTALADPLGAGPGSAAFRATGLILLDVDADVYSLQLGAGSRLSVTADHTRMGGVGGVTLSLHDASGALLMQGGGGTFSGDPWLYYVSPTAQTVFLAVRDNTGGGGPFPAAYEVEGTID